MCLSFPILMLRRCSGTGGLICLRLSSLWFQLGRLCETRGSMLCADFLRSKRLSSACLVMWHCAKLVCFLDVSPHPAFLNASTICHNHTSQRVLDECAEASQQSAEDPALSIYANPPSRTKVRVFWGEASMEMIAMGGGALGACNHFLVPPC